MSLPCYRYTHNRQAGTLLIGLDDETYLFETEDGNAHPLSLDDVIDLDTAEAAFLAQADALVGAWREVCQAAADLPDPEAARQTLRECLEVMSRAIDTHGKDPTGPALAVVPAPAAA